MIFSLAQDFHDAVVAMLRGHPKHRMLELLEEAIRRDIHFIARHPTTLFQCMWNSCWWYDCPEAAKHYEVPEGGWKEPPPWGGSGPKLHELLEEWQRQRQSVDVGSVWIRSIRPPKGRLNSGQVATLGGHEKCVSGLAYSPDGRQFASCSWDGTVQIWDTQTWGKPKRLCGHQGDVNGVAFSPDGVLLISGSVDGTVRVWNVDRAVEIKCLDVTTTEPTLGLQVAQQTVNAVRQVDTNHLIFIDGRNYSLSGIWQRDNGTNAFVHDLVTPPRLVYAPHVYYDAKGDSQYSEGNAPVTPWVYYVRDRLLPVLDWGEANEVPIFITESGIPNTESWAAVLSEVFSTYYQPLKLSHVYWVYDPHHSSSPLRLQATGVQLPVLSANAGGTYDSTEALTIADRHSPLYDSGPIAPWFNASWTNGVAVIDFCGGVDADTGKCMISVRFGGGWSGLKFYHDYLDTKRHAFLQFTIYGGPSGGQDLWIYTTDRHGNESPYKSLNDYVVLSGQTATVRIPLADLVSGQDSVITSVVFKNPGYPQPEFLIGDLLLLATKIPPVFTSASVSNETVRLSLGNLTSRYRTSIERSFDLRIADWKEVFAFEAVGFRTNWMETMSRERAFYRAR